MKTGPDAVVTVKNEHGGHKTRKLDPTPSEPPRTSPGAQNMKPDPKPSAPSKTCPGAQNMKTGSDALGIAENEYGDAKHENGT
jgi:hypothetical protein